MATQARSRPGQEYNSGESAQSARFSIRLSVLKSTERLGMTITGMLQRWIQALRSDEYAQGSGSLAECYVDEHGLLHMRHCCLGVLCEISNDVSSAIKDGAAYQFGGALATGTTMAFARTTADIAPLASWLLLLSPHKMASRQQILVRMNDAGRSFKDIADVLESWLPDAQQHDADLAKRTGAAQA